MIEGIDSRKTTNQANFAWKPLLPGRSPQRGQLVARGLSGPLQQTQIFGSTGIPL